MTLAPWDARPPEVAYLLNPAFVSLLIQATAAGYQERRDSGLPFIFAFLSVPLCVDPYSRERLPTNSATSLMVWLSQNPDVRFLMPGRAKDLRPIVKEALVYGRRAGAYTFAADASILPAAGPSYYRRNKTFTADMLSMHAKSNTVGKWLGRAGDEVSILSAWGVTP